MISEVEVSGRKAFSSANQLGASTTSFSLWVPPTSTAKYKVVSASARFHTASSSGAIQIEVAGAAIARGSGVNQLDATLSLAGTADTTVTQKASQPTVFGSESVVNVIISGTMTSLADCVVTVEFEKVN